MELGEAAPVNAEAATDFGSGYLQAQGLQLQVSGSQEQLQPHWQFSAAALSFVSLRVCCLRFGFMFVDFSIVRGAVPASLPGFTRRSPELTNELENHYTLFSHLSHRAPRRPGTSNPDSHARCTRRSFA